LSLFRLEKIKLFFRYKEHVTRYLATTLLCHINSLVLKEGTPVRLKIGLSQPLDFKDFQETRPQNPLVADILDFPLFSTIADAL